jgi:mannose-1-phosphate guanylyltransferase
VPVLNRPAIEWALAACRRAGITEILCNLHHLGKAIEQYFTAHASFGFQVSFSQEENILGTGGGLKKCEGMLADEDFLVLNGDVLMDIDVNALVAYHRKKKSRATVVLYPHKNSSAIVPVGVQGEKVVDFNNYFGTNLNSGFVYTGAAVLSPEIFNYLESGFSSIVYTGYVEFIRHHALYYYVHQGYWYDIGTPRSLYEANMELLEKKEDVGYYLSSIGSVITLVSGQALIDSSACVEHSIVGDHAVVRAKAKIHRSVVLPFSRVGDGLTLTNCLYYDDRIIEFLP